MASLLLSCEPELSSFPVTAIDLDNPAVPENPSTQSVTMTVCSFNIAYANSSSVYADGSSAAWSVRRDAVKKFVDTTKADIIGLQEIRKSQSLDFISFFENEYGYYDVSRSSKTGEPVFNTTGEGLGILYRKDRFELLKKGFFWLDTDPDTIPEKNSDGTYGDWNSACRRIVVYTVLKDKLNNDSPVYFFTAHFDHQSRAARVNSCQLVIDRIKDIAKLTELKKCDAAVFFVGDLNTAYDSGQLDVLNDNFYYARLDAPGDDENTGTFNGYGKSNTMIDHIYYGGKAIKPLKYRVDRENYGVPFISDHYPVLIQVEMGGLEPPSKQSPSGLSTRLSFL